MVNSIDTIMNNLSILNEQNTKVNYGLSTGNALQYGSDDTTKYDYILSIQSSINTYSSIESSINYTSSFNTASDTALSEIKLITESIIAESIKANTDTTNSDDKEIIATQIEAYMSSLYTLSNSSVNGQYLFSGSSTNTQSFSLDETTGVISYESDNSLKSVNVETNKYVNQGVNGIDVFYYTNQEVSASDTFTFSSNEIILDEDGNEWKLMDSNSDGVEDGLFLNGDTSSTSMSVTSNGDGTFTATNTSSSNLEVNHSLFDDLTTLVNALRLEDDDGNTISEDDATSIITQMQENLDYAYSSQNISHSIVGTRTNTIDTYSEIIQAKLTNLAVLESEYASADLTALAVEAQALENTYTALYSTINRVNSLSLVQYLN